MNLFAYSIFSKVIKLFLTKTNLYLDSHHKDKSLDLKKVEWLGLRVVQSKLNSQILGATKKGW